MTRRRYWVYGLLFLLNTISYTDRVNMSLAGRPVAQEFHLSPVTLGYLFSSFLWAYVLMMLPGGRLIDSLGAHRVAAMCCALWSVAQICTGLAVGFWTMLLARLGLGVGEAPVSPISYRSVRDWGPHTEHGTAIGVIQAGTLIGPALGAPIVGWLITVMTWRGSFFVTGAVGLVWTLVWIALVTTPERTRWLPDAERQKILAERHVGEPPPVSEGIGYRGLLRSPTMWGVAISQGCAVYSLYLYLSWLPNYLQTTRHVSMVASGLFTSVPFLVGAAVIVIVNKIGDAILTPETLRSGKRRLVVATCLVLTAGGVFIPYAQSLALVVLLTILPVSFSNTATAVNAALTSDLLRSPGDAGRAFAFLVLGGNVFGLLAPIVTGYIVQATGSFSSAFVLAGILALVGAATSLLLTRHTLGEDTPTLTRAPVAAAGV
ncbi:MAG TPA: MFS transporter [Acetobacteraceae bacterium]|nr:MFS transporter [Acetobacteraceae bacterium]